MFSRGLSALKGTSFHTYLSALPLPFGSHIYNLIYMSLNCCYLETVLLKWSLRHATVNHAD
jgi:hypothetical protein